MVTCLFELGRILLILKPGTGHTLQPAALPAAEAASLCRCTREAKTTGPTAAVVVALLALPTDTDTGQYGRVSLHSLIG